MWIVPVYSDSQGSRSETGMPTFFSYTTPFLRQQGGKERTGVKNPSSLIWGQRQTLLWLCRVLEVCITAFIFFERNLVCRISLLALFWKKTFMGGYRVRIIILGDCVCFSITQVSRSHTYGIRAAFLHIIYIYEF